MTTHAVPTRDPASASLPRPAGPEGNRRHPAAAALGRLRAFDPGWSRMRLGVVVVSIVTAIIGVEWLFVGQTGALQVDTHGAALPAAQAAKVGFANHAAIVSASLTGVSAGLLALVALVDPRPRQMLIALGAVSGTLLARNRRNLSKGDVRPGLAGSHHRRAGRAARAATVAGRNRHGSCGSQERRSRPASNLHGRATARSTWGR